MKYAAALIIAAFTAASLLSADPLEICKQSFSDGECVYQIR